VEPLGAASLLAPAIEAAWPGAGEPLTAHAASFVVLLATSSVAAAFTMASSVALSPPSPLHRGSLAHGLFVNCGRLIEHPRPSTGKFPQPLLQRLILVGQYLVVIKDDTRQFALAGGRSTGTTSGASSTARRGTPTATYWTAAYRDASMACWWVATAVTTIGVTRTTGPGDDHAAGLVTSLHWSNVDVVQRGHYHHQRYPHYLVRVEGLTGRCWCHEFSRGLVRC
jgi:hypothetical protein